MGSGGKSLVVYYSLTGNTERVARDLAARLGSELERIEDRKNRRGVFGLVGAALDAALKVSAKIAEPRIDPSEYALTIICTPVWASKMTPAVRAYLGRTSGRLNEVAFVTTAGSTEVGRIVPEMQALAGRAAMASMGFTAGELKDSSRYEKKVSGFVQLLQAPRV